MADDRDEMELILLDVAELVKAGMVTIDSEGGLHVTDQGLAAVADAERSVWN